MPINKNKNELQQCICKSTKHLKLIPSGKADLLC